MDQIFSAIGWCSLVPEANRLTSIQLATDWLALAVLAHWDVFSAVPLDGEISYAHLAAKVGLAEERLRRFIRQAMTNHIFTESRPGFVAHTATSAVPARIPSFRWYIEHNTEDGGPAYPHVIPALEKWGASDQPAKSGFGIAFGLDAKDSKDSVFQFVAEDGEGEKKGFRMRRIGNAMEGMKGDGAYNVGHAQNGFDWASLGDDAIVVDVRHLLSNQSHNSLTNTPRSSAAPSAISPSKSPAKTPTSNASCKIFPA